MLLRFFHIILATAVLLSTTGVTINRHYCQNRLVDTALFVQANACKGMPVKATPCAKHPAKQKRNCCKDKSEFHKPDLNKQLVKIAYKAFQFSWTLALEWPEMRPEISQVEQKIISYLHYRPPLIRLTTSALLQVFRL